MLAEQLKDMQAEGLLSTDEVPWLKENARRRKRWADWFSGRQELAEDRVLKRNHVTDPKELGMLRRQTEVMMETFLEKVSKVYRINPEQLLQEQTTTADIATWTNTALALIRRIWPRLFANQLASVQPMRGPTTRAHTLDFVYCSSGETYSPSGSTYSSVYPNEDPDYSDCPAECAEPNRLCLRLTSATITAECKSLAAEWSAQASQDLDSQYGLNLEGEMDKISGMQIEREINRTVINGVANAATTNTTWTSTQPAAPNAWSNATPRQYAESIFDAICDADNQIFTRVYEHANVILCGATFANRLRKLNSFRSLDTVAGESRVVSGPNLFGVLNEQYRCFHDPFYTADGAIVAHKSDNWMYTGYVYLPYVALWSTPLIWNTAMCPGKGFMTRFGRYAKNGDFFATVSVV